MGRNRPPAAGPREPREPVVGLVGREPADRLAVACERALFGHDRGLDHLAIACEEESELHRVAGALSEAGIENTGGKLDETLGKLYVAFKDPDRIAWEFYMA